MTSTMWPCFQTKNWLIIALCGYSIKPMSPEHFCDFFRCREAKKIVAWSALAINSCEVQAAAVMKAEKWALFASEEKRLWHSLAFSKTNLFAHVTLTLKRISAKLARKSTGNYTLFLNLIYLFRRKNVNTNIHNFFFAFDAGTLNNIARWDWIQVRNLLNQYCVCKVNKNNFFSSGFY